ncbi:MAG TPA: endonuclease III [Bacteroidota bacterium]|nr:endonuclease III [Bacteroidota bacterium]
MSSKKPKIDLETWGREMERLVRKYGGRHHPLQYRDRYQLVAMVILSSQSTDERINELAPQLFEAFPTIGDLAHAQPEEVYRYFPSVRGCIKKAKWLIALGKEVGSLEEVPHTMAGLTKLPGVGRKSANVIIRESGDEAEGIIVDIHVLRVAPRLGIARGEDPKKIERQMMDILPKEMWNEAGMALSFLGRETCRPTDPKCEECVLNSVCDYFASLSDGRKRKRQAT